MEKYIQFFEKCTNDYLKIAKNEFQIIHMKRKIEHSKRVNKFAIEIAEKLNLSKEDIYVVNIASLLHDIGRFKQFYKYNTFVDKDSCDHALLGFEILNDANILNELDEKQKEMILEAIKMHSYRKLPNNISDKLYKITTILQDADKIDIINSMVNIIPKLSKKDQKVFYSNKQDKKSISQKVIEMVLNNEILIKSDLETIEEIRIANIGWVTSAIKYLPSLEIIKRERLIEKSFDLIYDFESKDIIFTYINNYINENLKIMLNLDKN